MSARATDLFSIHEYYSAYKGKFGRKTESKWTLRPYNELQPLSHAHNLVPCSREEMERQRLLEWEQSRKKELTEHRQREQDKLFQLKARHENSNKELEAMVRMPNDC